MAFGDVSGIFPLTTLAATGRPPSSDFPTEEKMHPRVIGFTGLKGSGKDSAGKVFVDHGWELMKFADVLKDMLRTLARARGCPDAQLERYIEGDLKEQPNIYFGGASCRHAMQTLGTEWGRKLIHEELWTGTLALRAQRAMERGNSVVVTDVRFPNEVDTIHRLGGGVFRVDRGQNAVAVANRYTAAQDHPSEKFVAELKVDGVILNNAPYLSAFQVDIEKRFF